MNKNSQRWEKEKRYLKEPDRGDSQYIVKDILKPAKDLSSISGKQRVNNIFSEQKMDTVSFIF